MPKVSVVIPVCNRAGMVVEAIDSVLSQSYADFELIVVDDGSTDGTARAVRRFGDRVTLVQRENGGVSAARNSGIAASRGDLIAFLDSDDLWLPGKLAAQAGYMDVFAHAALCHTGEIWIRGGRRINPKQKHAKARGHDFRRLLRDCLISPSSIMIRRDILLAAGGFDETLTACEDYALWLKLSREHEIHLIDRALVVKRGGHDDQLSRTVPALDRFRVRALLDILPDMDGEEAFEVRSVIAEKCRILAGGFESRGNADEAAHYHRLAREYCP